MKVRHILGVIGALALVPTAVFAATNWPGSTVRQADIAIDHAGNYEPSGLLWHEADSVLYTVSDDGKVTVMTADGNNQETREPRKAGIGKDYEAITMVQDHPDLLYIGVEHPDSIVEYNWRTGQFGEKWWDLTSVMTGPNNLGLEGLAFVPNEFLPANRQSNSGGVFFAGIQRSPVAGGSDIDDYLIYGFDIDLSTSKRIASWWGIPVPAGTPGGDISDISFNADTGLLYVLYDGANRLIEMKTDGTVINDYRSVPVNNQEGVAVVTTPGEDHAMIYLASDSDKSIGVLSGYPVSLLAPEPEPEPIPEVSNEALVSYLKLDRNGADFSGNNHAGVLKGNVGFADGQVNGAAVFDGNGDYLAIGNSRDINTAVHGERSVSMWFKASDTNRRQVIFEEGAHVRGLAIYLDAGRLYVAGWNTPANESNWQGTYLSTNVSANEWHHVVLTLDGSASLEPEAFRAYLDGELMGVGAGSQLWSHSGNIGVGAVNNGILFHDGDRGNTGGQSLAGSIDEFRLYNRVLSAAEVRGLQQYEEAPAVDHEVDEDPVSRANLVMHLLFNQDSLDASGEGNNAQAKKGAGMSMNGKFGAAATFDGQNDYYGFADSNLINLGTHGQRSIAFWFNPSDIQSRQVLFEEGGTVRGLNIYIENGRLYVAGWNEPGGESNWQGTYLDLGPVQANQWQHVALTLNGGAETVADALKGYKNGVRMASGHGSQLWSHSGNIGLGATNNDTKFASGDRKGTAIDAFAGMIDDVRVYNEALSADEVNQLFRM